MSELAALSREITACMRCNLCKSRNKAVPGEGPEHAKIMFVGEAPGWHENQQGRPFVGPAGKLLDELLTSVHLKRSDVYICNVIKCWPPSNRDPLPHEVEACAPYLQRQIEMIQPKIIVTLGRYSMAKFFPGQSISRIHGTALRRDGIVYFAMYHPAAALHQQSLKKPLFDDMKKIPTLLAELEAVQDEAERPQQLSMF